MLDLIKIVADELGLSKNIVENTVKLLDEDSTVPFIARYRKEVTGSLDEEQIRNIEEKINYLRNLEKRKEEVLNLVCLDKNVLKKFPSQLSGGQIQRVVIAIALSRDIKILLLDEPTTALDEENKKNIIDLINEIKKHLNILILFVTHDINSIQNICKDIIILKNGEIIEKGLTNDILSTPKEDYTKRLINSTFKNKIFRT